MLDWGGSDQLFAKWWEDHVVDFTLSSRELQISRLCGVSGGKVAEGRRDGIKSSGPLALQSGAETCNILQIHTSIYLSARTGGRFPPTMSIGRRTGTTGPTPKNVEGKLYLLGMCGG